jgi:multidrug efflux pump subunit AcrA (membrane-fusion protein)
MSRTSAVRRGAAALGVSVLIALSLAGPAAAKQDPSTGDLHGTVSTVPRDPHPTPRVIRVDDNALEYVQIGGGLLAGMALAGAGATLVSRRNHAHVTPA